MAETEAYRWTPERYVTYPRIQEVVASPDGRAVLCVVREPLLSEERSEYLSHLYLATADGDGTLQQLTFGEHRNTNPQWSPDGVFIAFVSTRSGTANLYAMRAAGGEAWALTGEDKTGVSSPKWSPDGSRIAFLQQEPPSEEREKARKARNDAVQVDMDLEFTYLFVVPFAVGPRTQTDPTQITRGRYQVTAFNWLTDGGSLAIVYQPTPDDDTWTQTRLGLVPADGSAAAPAEIARVSAEDSTPYPSPDGAWIACATADQPVTWAFAARVVLYPIAGGAPHVLAATPNAQPMLASWSPEGDMLYVQEVHGVSMALLALPVDGSAPRMLFETPLTALSANAQGQIAVAAHDFDRPNTLYRFDHAAGALTRIATPLLPAGWPEAPRSEVVHWQARDGASIEGILVYPPDYRAGARFPLIVHVHGGPAGVFQRGYATERIASAALAERGYLVLQPNPRGSTGYGATFRAANRGDWGGGDYRDIMAGVDHLIAEGRADPDRLGIMGFSYGGFMTSWTITQTKRFKAAVAGGAVTDPVAFNGTSDIPSFIPDYFGAEFWDDPEPYRRQSPLLHVQQVTTPCLILHGESDVRVPVEQGRAFYQALKRRGIPTEMVTYPRQGHSFDEPRLYMDFIQRHLDWFDRWLGSGGN